MEIRTRHLAGNICCVAVYNGLMRFCVEGSFYEAPQNLDDRAAQNRLAATHYTDGSVSICEQTLIPWETPDEKMALLCDETLNKMEALLNIPYGCLSSSSWNAGHTDKRWDHLLTDAEQHTIYAAET